MYELNGMFWYKLIFVTELLIAETLIVYRLKRRKKFILRLFLSVIGVYGLALAVPVFSNEIANSAMFLVLFLLTVGGIKICFDERWVKILFCAVAAYTLQHIAYEIFELLALAMGIYNVDNIYGSTSFEYFIIYTSNGSSFVSGNPFTVMLSLFVYSVTYFFGFLFIKNRIGGRKDFGVDNVKMFVLAAVILFFDIIVSSLISYYSRRDFNATYVAFLDIFNVFCCIFALYLQFVVDNKNMLESDLKIIKRLWKEKEYQYNLSKSNIALINQKCHDLKHQIRRIGTDSALDKNVVKEIEDVISIYDSPVKTGNEALDIILTEKSLYCSRNGIKLCCIADGRQLDFMTSADLYALFGNIVDNAIEAVEKLDEGKRTISLTIKKTAGFLAINLHNYYDGEIQFEGKLPKTIKSDKAYHGYGMKSVEMLCAKYGGEMSIKTENSVFNLNIVFPVNGLRS